ncbi:PAS domain S-box protein [Flavobacterium sp. WC2509]|uniref:PAS domain S-box protein n=1 Tax=Flavobacterium sp. WC2509 TaxID=3461406 RepID=UPI004043DF29
MGENINIENNNIPKFLNSTTKIVFSTVILYFLIAKLSLFIFLTEINILPFFPSIGFAIAATLLLGRKAVFGVAIGCFLFSISLYKNDFQNAATFEELIKPLAICIIRPIIAGLNAFLVSYLSQLWCKTKYPFGNKKNVLFFAFASLLGTFISVSIGFMPLAMTSYFYLDNSILIWSNMLRGNALGAIVFTPLVVSWFYNTENITQWTAAKKAESCLLIISTLTLSLYIFETHANNESILFFLLIWAASRFGMRVITLVSLIITIIAIYCTGHRMGGFIFNGWDNDFLMLQLFLFVNMVSILFLKAILQEKENEENKLKISEQDLGLEKNILKAAIESPKGISISCLDTNLNYLSFNSTHAKYMKNEYGVDIKIGENHIEYITKENRKEEINSIYQTILKGSTFSVEEKDATGQYWTIYKSPIKNQDRKIIGTTTIVTNITDLKLKEIQLEKNNYSLNERIKELRCLFDITKIISNKALSKSEKMEACVQIIPKAMQFPEIANCRIQFGEKVFISDNYKENDWFLNQKITVNGEECGWIEVGYFDAKKLEKENIFLDEEIKLLETLSDIISKSVETKIAEEKLLKSEETYRVLFENVQDVFFKTSVKTGEIVDASPSCITFNGITREELIGQNRSFIYSDKNQMQLMFQKIITEQKVVDYYNEITIKGKHYYVSINAKVIFDSNGEPEFVIGSIKDITERKLAEENLKVSEEKFRAMFENIQDIYYMHTLDGKIFEISPSVEKHFKYTREEMIGKYTSELYYDSTKQNEFREKITRDGSITDEHVQLATATGEAVYFSVNCKIIYDKNGKPSHVEGSMRNINDRIINQQKLVVASEKIKESEEKFRSIFENFEDVYFRTTVDGMILDVSPSFEKHFLRPSSQAIESSVFNFYYNKEDRESLLKKLKEEGQVRDSDIRFVDGNGNIVFFSVNARLIYDENGRPIYIEKSMRNVNDRIAFQKEMLAKNRTLEFQNTELEQFAYIASHDLQEPLITVIHCIQMLQEEIGGNLDEDQKQYLQFINSSTSRMQILVKGLLDYSRIGKERKTSKINCNEIVANVLADMNVSLTESNADVKYENLPVIEGNTTEMRQLFQNMISNANKFRKKDQQPKIKITAVKEENNWLFSIQDNGIGIEAEDMNKVFVIFKRLNNRSEYHGTGIGLSHCKKIIEQHKGKIWVESKVNEGSTFKWTFPVEQN